jgi:hypothetical protein
MYKIRRTFAITREPGAAKKVAELVYKQTKIYRDAGQRSDFTVSFNEKTLPGEQYIVLLEWTDDKIMSPGRSGNDIPAEAIEAGKKYRPLVEHDYIEFFEMIDPIIMGDSN